MFTKIKPVIKAFVPVIVAVFAVGAIVFAWTEPSVTPPNPDPNVAVPLNTGLASQSKKGNLALNTDGRWENGLLIPFGKVGIGTTTPESALVVNGQIQLANGGIKFPDGKTQNAAFNPDKIGILDEYSAVFGATSRSISFAQADDCQYGKRSAPFAAGFSIDTSTRLKHIKSVTVTVNSGGLSRTVCAKALISIGDQKTALCYVSHFYMGWGQSPTGTKTCSQNIYLSEPAQILLYIDGEYENISNSITGTVSVSGDTYQRTVIFP